RGLADASHRRSYGKGGWPRAACASPFQGEAGSKWLVSRHAPQAELGHGAAYAIALPPPRTPASCGADAPRRPIGHPRVAGAVRQALHRFAAAEAEIRRAGGRDRPAALLLADVRQRAAAPGGEWSLDA